MCPHLKVTPQCVSASSRNTNLASSDLRKNTPHRESLPNGLTRVHDMLIITLEGCVSCSLHMRGVKRRRGGWVICARQEEGEGRLEEEREEGGYH